MRRALRGWPRTRLVVLCMGISGALAGLAGMFEVTRTGGADQHRLQLGLRVHRDHRGLPRAAQPPRHRAGGASDGADLYRRRDGAVHAGPARRRRSRSSRGCCCSSSWRWTCCRTTASALSVSGGPRDGDLRRDQSGILIASLMVAAVPIMLAAIGETGGREGGRAEPRRRGDDDHRRGLRLCRGGRDGKPVPGLRGRRSGGGGAVA